MTGTPSPGVAPRSADGGDARVDAGSSPALLAPGYRTLGRPGWRGSIASALAVVLSSPRLWLLGVIGFAVRGGILLLALLIVVLPTPVEVRQLLGDNLASSGLTPAFLAMLLPIGGAALIAVVGALLLSARVELAAFESFVDDHESGEEPGDRRVSSGRGGLLGRLFLVQLAAAALLAMVALPLALSVYDATTQELLRPTPGGEVLYIRVIWAVREPLFLLMLAIVVVDMLSALASRELMCRHFGLAERGGTGTQPRLAALAAIVSRPLRRPVGSVATSALAWLLTAAVLVPVAWALDVAWDSTRAAYLGQRADADPAAIAWLVLVTLLFAAMWGAAVLAAGVVSALRAGLWTAEALR